VSLSQHSHHDLPLIVQFDTLNHALLCLLAVFVHHCETWAEVVEARTEQAGLRGIDESGVGRTASVVKGVELVSGEHRVLSEHCYLDVTLGFYVVFNC